MRDKYKIWNGVTAHLLWEADMWAEVLFFVDSDKYLKSGNITEETLANGRGMRVVDIGAEAKTTELLRYRRNKNRINLIAR